MQKNISLEFDEATLNELFKALGLTHDLAREGGKQGIEYLANKAYTRMRASCPVDTGALLNSSYLEFEVVGDVITSHFGHGGQYQRINPKTRKNTDDYAIEVHEGYKIKRNGKKPGSVRKWAEKAVNSIRPEFVPVLQEYIAAALLKKSPEQLKASLRSIQEELAVEQLAKKQARMARIDFERQQQAKYNTKWQSILKSVRESTIL